MLLTAELLLGPQKEFFEHVLWFIKVIVSLKIRLTQYNPNCPCSLCYTPVVEASYSTRGQASTQNPRKDCSPPCLCPPSITPTVPHHHIPAHTFGGSLLPH